MSATRTVVPTGTRVEGRVECAGDLVVEGTCIGSLEVGGTLIVAAGAVCQARVHANAAQVLGELLGDLACNHSISVASGARVVGDLRAPDVSVDGNAEVDGTIDLLAPAPAPHAIVRAPVEVRGPSLRRPRPPARSSSPTNPT